MDIGNTFENCTVNVIAKPYPPFVTSDGGGFEIEVLKTVGSILNINFNITMSKDSVDSWGDKLENSWTGNLNLVHDKLYLGIGNLDTNIELLRDFDFSQFYHMEPLVYVVPAAKFVPKWRVLSAIFTIEMWAICFAVLIIFGFIFYCTSRSKGITRIQDPLLYSLQVIIGHAVDRHPVHDIQRIFFVSLSIFSIILSSIYTCSLIYYLKNPIKQHQIKSSQEIFDVFGNMRYTVGGIAKYRMLYNVSYSDEIQKIFETYETISEENETVEYWLNLVSNREDLWTISSEFFVKYLLALNSNSTTYPDGQPKLFPLHQQLLSYPVSLIMRKGHPLLRKINPVITRLLCGGLVIKFCEKYLSEIGKDDSMDNMQNTTPFEALSLEHLQGAFAILTIGYVSGGITMLLEFFMKTFLADYIKI
nr:uncharacterized protein LOC111511904 [Leptinotarsa decemlineata]XP_023023738.1 uncharacterized protein LOC111511904 [Leptinotarsa decemlineata]XP_023023740.1 uncharacterized protein LOC111511904 [Leptinotarsa decemlineata]XP_023023741.1 uncharacterized protein LOC111511904 [Leptinotarsa decemlineata]